MPESAPGAPGDDGASGTPGDDGASGTPGDDGAVGMAPAPGGLLSRVAALRAPKSAAVQRSLLAAAAVVFIVLGGIALANFPDDLDHDPNWWLLAVVGVVGPLATITCNTLEFVQQNRLMGLRVRFLAAARVSVLGTAANLLPVPGSVLVRTQAMASAGAGYRKAATATAVVGIAWLGATAAVAGPASAVAGAPRFGAVVTVAGAALLGVSAVLVRRQAPPEGAGRVFAAIVAVEVATTVVGAARLLLIIIGLGLEVTPSQALALTLSGALANATGIFPAGLGIREGITAAIAGLVGLSASAGFVAAAADRVAGLIVVGVLAVVLAARPDTDATAHVLPPTPSPPGQAPEPPEVPNPSPGAQAPTL